MSVEPKLNPFVKSSAEPAIAVSSGRCLWLVGVNEDIFAATTIEHLHRHWDVVRYVDLLRVREALLMGARPSALVIQNVDLAQLNSDFIQRLQSIVHGALFFIANDSSGNHKAVALAADHSYNRSQLAEVPASDYHPNPPSIDQQLLVLLRPFELHQSEQIVVSQPEVTQAAVPFTSTSPAAPSRISSLNFERKSDRESIDSKELVLQWLEKHPHRQKAGMLMLGKLHLRSTDASESEVPRPLRIALLKQKLRSEDDILADEQGRFWALLTVTDEMIAIRIALRLCLAMTRSSDPNHYAVGVGLAGAYINDSAQDAHRICEVTLPAFEANGQVSVAVDRWRFSLPMSVAQALL